MNRGPINVLVVGSGGREHALYKAIKKSPLAGDVFFAPGNGGVSEKYCFSIEPTKFERVGECARDVHAGLVVIGPETPLAYGIVDHLEGIGIPAFGPSRDAAKLEASKRFTRGLGESVGVPGPRFKIEYDFDLAVRTIRSDPTLRVIKADGLAEGKGVTVRVILKEGKFGDQGLWVVIEELLEGDECSVIAFCDGEHFELLPTSRDFKRAFNGDVGPNTGGMPV